MKQILVMVLVCAAAFVSAQDTLVSKNARILQRIEFVSKIWAPIIAEADSALKEAEAGPEFSHVSFRQPLPFDDDWKPGKAQKRREVRYNKAMHVEEKQKLLKSALRSRAIEIGELLDQLK